MTEYIFSTQIYFKLWHKVTARILIQISLKQLNREIGRERGGKKNVKYIINYTSKIPELIWFNINNKWNKENIGHSSKCYISRTELYTPSGWTQET